MNKFLGLTIALAMAGSVYAQVPGKDRPIRVGQYKGTGQGRYWHTNIHTSGAQLAAILANPDSTGLGPDIIKPTAGFSFTQFGLQSGTGTPSTGLRDAFIQALDTLDVVLISCFVDIGQSISAGAPRTALMNHIQKKGYIAVHATTDSYGTWPGLDSIHAARFQNHPSSDRNGRLRLDSLDGSYNTDPAWAYLNTSLADTTFTEEWFSFTTNGNVIRSYPGVKVTVNIDESSYAGGMGGARAMGTDHPMSWYRVFPEGGRFFYTAVGHRANIWAGGAANPRFLRRQLYNAILWTAGYDTAASVSIKPQAAKSLRFADVSRMSAGEGALTVTMLQAGTHSVELTALDGRRIAMRRGEGRDFAYKFASLQPGVYSVSVNTQNGRSSQLVTVR